MQGVDGSGCQRWHKPPSPLLGDRAGVKGEAGACWEVLAQGAGRVWMPREGGDPEMLCVRLSDGTGVTSLRRDRQNNHSVLGRERLYVMA